MSQFEHYTNHLNLLWFLGDDSLSHDVKSNLIKRVVENCPDTPIDTIKDWYILYHIEHKHSVKWNCLTCLFNIIPSLSFHHDVDDIVEFIKLMIGGQTTHDSVYDPVFRLTMQHFVKHRDQKNVHKLYTWLGDICEIRNMATSYSLLNDYIFRIIIRDLKNPTWLIDLCLSNSRSSRMPIFFLYGYDWSCFSKTQIARFLTLLKESHPATTLWSIVRTFHNVSFHSKTHDLLLGIWTFFQSGDKSWILPIDTTNLLFVIHRLFLFPTECALFLLSQIPKDTFRRETLYFDLKNQIYSPSLFYFYQDHQIEVMEKIFELREPYDSNVRMSTIQQQFWSLPPWIISYWTQKFQLKTPFFVDSFGAPLNIEYFRFGIQYITRDASQLRWNMFKRWRNAYRCCFNYVMNQGMSNMIHRQLCLSQNVSTE